MRVWLVQLGEPIPTEAGVRLFRCGLLAERLAATGHDVTWWTSAFSHYRKVYRADRPTTVFVRDNYRIQLLYAKGYRQNTSVARLRFHHEMTRAFRTAIKQATPPTLILAGFPTPGLAASAVDYGKARRVPVLIDVRDLWPDVFVDLVPGALSWIMRLGMWPWQSRNKRIFSEATGIVAISKDYLDWALERAGRPPGQWDRVVLMGYPNVPIEPTEKERARLDWLSRGVKADAFICCFFGTLNRHFDMATVIGAAAALERRKGHQFQFILCGDGTHLDRAKGLAKELATVMLPGWVSASQIAALMELAKVGLVPYTASSQRSLPNKPFEYFAGGLPVISSLRGELHTLLTENECGSSYESGNISQLCDLLEGLAGDELRRRTMARNARCLFEERFSSDHVTANLLQHLEGVASGALVT
jgi:glycosyltransferase involved in cell wall biosynthesis